MMIEVLKSKIHCARVTEANLNYMGSITIDEDLLDAANMIPGEKVYIADNNNGERLEGGRWLKNLDALLSSKSQLLISPSCIRFDILG